MTKQLIKTTYAVIRPTGQDEPGKVDWPEDPGYARISRLVRPLLGGAHMERVNVWHDGAYTDMFVDEMGKLKDLPVNHAATEVYHANMKTHSPAAYDKAVIAGTMPKIYGVAVLFSRPVWL